jgi:4'-phosphopantetheinyl transferase
MSTTRLMCTKISPFCIHLWHIPLTAEHQPNLNVLSFDEQNRYHKFYFPEHRLRFALAKEASRRILSLYLPLQPQDIEFTTGPHGKPRLVSSCSLEFNLSHSRDQAILAVGQQHPLGVDLEFMSTRPYLGIAADLFSPKELHALTLLHPALLALNFFSLWSQKEALIKQLGLGLRYPTQGIDLQALPQQPYHIDEPLYQTPLKIKAWWPTPGLSAALCYDPCIQHIHHYHYDPFVSLENLAATPGIELPA